MPKPNDPDYKAAKRDAFTGHPTMQDVLQGAGYNKERAEAIAVSQHIHEIARDLTQKTEKATHGIVPKDSEAAQAQREDAKARRIADQMLGTYTERTEALRNARLTVEALQEDFEKKRVAQAGGTGQMEGGGRM
ncbi:hypothetical protein SpCBS45565_g04511 [Spizellomyces sp. 'palustris']|nr:hypothetical protein SpCBS45565_g04511 [Spizellomyces sp. 'palustris']